MTKDTNAIGDKRDYYVATESEIDTIPVADIGSYIYVVNGGVVYMSDGTQWVKQ